MISYPAILSMGLLSPSLKSCSGIGLYAACVKYSELETILSSAFYAGVYEHGFTHQIERAAQCVQLII